MSSVLFTGIPYMLLAFASLPIDLTVASPASQYLYSLVIQFT